LNKAVIVDFKQGKFNAGKNKKSLSNVKPFAKRKEAVDSIFVMKFAASLEPHPSLIIILAI